jgi:hypothetical protein
MEADEKSKCFYCVTQKVCLLLLAVTGFVDPCYKQPKNSFTAPHQLAQTQRWTD